MTRASVQTQLLGLVLAMLSMVILGLASKHADAPDQGGAVGDTTNAMVAFALLSSLVNVRRTHHTQRQRNAT